MGTKKLTRKEIIGEDPVHDTLIRVVELFRSQGRTIALIAGVVVLAGVGVYFGLEYLESREKQALQKLSRGMEMFHGTIDPGALDDPYGKGSQPLFRTEEAKFKAAGEQFSSVISDHTSSKAAVIARYYLGLCHLRLGQQDEAVKALEVVRNNTKDRTVGYLAKKVLARHYLDAGNPKGAQEILEGMIKDPQCDLPKEDLQVDLSRALVAQGKREEAIQQLREARDQEGGSILRTMVLQELSRLEGNPGSF